MSDNRVPILFLSDAIAHTSGLARITRDLSTRVHRHLGDVFDVASCGYGAPGSRLYPFTQYHAAVSDWEVQNLPEIVEDHFQGRKGVLMTVWDSTRLGWLVDPILCSNPALTKWLEAKPFDLWGYFPIDAEGPNGLPVMQSHIINKFDRALFYTLWAAKLAERSLGHPFNHLPHGIENFYPLPKVACKEWLIENKLHPNLKPEQRLIGVVATNQIRKDWALAVETISILKRNGMDVNFWFHTDSLDRHWDIQGLLHEFGLRDRGLITTEQFTDEAMNRFYSACDCTLGTGLGEGWGMPLGESLYSGTPVIHGDYAGATDFIPNSYLVPALAYRYEGLHCLKRPVFDTERWANRARWAMSMPCEEPKIDFRWDSIWAGWEKWFREGLRDDRHK